MRCKTTLVVLLSTLLYASNAVAFSLDMRLNPASADPTNVLAPGDELLVDVYLDADRGLGFLGVAVLFDDDGILSYDPAGASMPSYILYTGPPAPTYVIPNVSPPIYWNGINQPGKKQLLVEFLEHSLGSATASGTNIWLATIAFPVTSLGDGESTLDLTLDAAGTIVEAYTVRLEDVTPVSGSFTVRTGKPARTCVAKIDAIDLGAETQLNWTVGGEGAGRIGMFAQLPTGHLLTLFAAPFADLAIQSFSTSTPQPDLPQGVGMGFGVRVQLSDGTFCEDHSILVPNP